MGIKSTHSIERDLAIEIITTKIHQCSNDQIANMLEEFDESYYRNYFVHDRMPERDEFDAPFRIESIEQFNKPF